MAPGTHDALEDERNEQILISVNGELFPRNEARVSVFDSGYLVGEGSRRAYGCTMVCWFFWRSTWHVLYQGAKAMALDIGMTRRSLPPGYMR